jgi:hypothetical protein
VKKTNLITLNGSNEVNGEITNEVITNPKKKIFNCHPNFGFISFIFKEYKGFDSKSVRATPFLEPP